ncbi:MULTISPECIES: TonB-dependent receptor domain-containing protein [unclassified Luteimonas]
MLFIAMTACLAGAVHAQEEGDASPSEALTLDSVVVTGSSIRGVAPVGSAALGFNREQIESTGLTNTTDILRTIPQVMNFGADSSLRGGGAVQNSTQNITYGRGINLRAVGTSSTLVLLDGKRLAPGSVAAQLTDVSAIPEAALGRIEVVADGASAIYGSDAVAGVVNLILRRPFDGAETRMGYGLGDDASSWNFSQLFGKTWGGGGGYVAYQRQQTDLTLSTTRPHLYDANFTPYGRADGRSLYAVPGNILFSAAQVPAGAPTLYALPQHVGGALDLSGLSSADPHRLNTWENTAIIPDSENDSFLWNVRHLFESGVQLSFTGLYSDRSFREPYAYATATQSTLLVPASNPYSPCATTNYVANPLGIDCADQDMRVYYRSIGDLGVAERFGYAKQYFTNVGADMPLGEAWMIKGSVGYSGARDHRGLSNQINNAALAMSVGNSVSGTTGAVVAPGTPGSVSLPAAIPVLNPFCTGCNDPATADFIRGAQYIGSQYDMVDVQVGADGPLFEIGGGEVRMAAGIAYRSDRMSGYNDTQTGLVYTSPRNISFQTADWSGSRDVKSAYAEFYVPLVGEHQELAWARSLELSIAGRYDRYSDFGSTTNPKVGLTWKTGDSLTLRSSYGESFRAPTLADASPMATANVAAGRPGGGVHSAAELGVTSVPADQQLYVIGTQGGRLGLQPETAKTWTAGFDLHPAGLPGFEASVSYYNIDYRNRIGTPSSDMGSVGAITHVERLYDPFLALNPLYFPERAASNGNFNGFDTSSQAGYDAYVSSLINGSTPAFTGAIGPVNQVAAVNDARRSNSGRLLTDGFDISVYQRLQNDWGNWLLGLTANYALSWENSPVATGELRDTLNEIYSPLRLSGRVQVGLSRDAWSAHLFYNYRNSYTNTLNVPVEYRDIDAYNTFDASFSYTPALEGLLGGATLNLSMQNLLDEDPPFALNSNILFDPQVASALGRYVTLQVSKKW